MQESPDRSLSLSARSVPFDPIRRAAAAKAAGFTGIGITVGEYASVTGGVAGRALVESIAEIGIGITEIEFLHRWTEADDRVQRRDEEAAEELAGLVGLRQVTAGLPEQVAPDVGPGEVIERFVALCSRLTLDVALEFMPFGPIPNLATAVRLVKAAEENGARLVLDSWHWLTAVRAGLQSPDEPPPAAAMISRVQLAGVRANAENTRVESLTHRQVPTPTDGDLLGFLESLRAVGYRGPFSCEVIRPQMAPSELGPFLRSCSRGCRAVLDVSGTSRDPGGE